MSIIDISIFTLLAIQSDQQQADLWSPLPKQGWKPCIHSTSVPCELLLSRYSIIYFYAIYKEFYLVPPLTSAKMWGTILVRMRC